MIAGPLVQPSLGLAAEVHVTGADRLGHVHPDCELMLLLSGQVRYGHAGAVVELPPGRLVLFSAALPHGVLEASGGAEVAWATVAIEQVLRWGLPEPFINRLLSGALVIDAGDLALDRGAMLRWAGDLRRGGDASRRAVALEIEARILRFAASDAALRPGRTPAGDRVQRMLAWLATHYRDPAPAAGLAAAAGLTPNHAMTVFRRATGVTVLRYVTQLRLAHAHRLLVTSDRSVLAIALEAGFGSQAQFYEVFRRAFATTPAAVRGGSA